MANITVKKGLIGQEDINLGTGTFSRAKSDGSAQTITKVNAEQLITLPAGTRTVSTVTDYLANNAVHNVKDYGATGDGTTDDAAAIQLAIDAANTAGGGTVYFPATSDYYLLTSYLTLKSNVSLCGHGSRPELKSATVIGGGYGDIFMPGNLHPDFTEDFTYYTVVTPTAPTTTISVTGNGSKFAVGDQVLVASTANYTSGGGYTIPSYQWNNIVTAVSSDTVDLLYPIDEVVAIKIAVLSDETCRGSVEANFLYNAVIEDLTITTATTGGWVSDSGTLDVEFRNLTVTSKRGVYGNAFQHTTWSNCQFFISDSAGEQSLCSLHTLCHNCSFTFVDKSAASPTGMTIAEQARHITFDHCVFDFSDYVAGVAVFRVINAQAVTLSNSEVLANGTTGLSVIQLGDITDSRGVSTGVVSRELSVVNTSVKAYTFARFVSLFPTDHSSDLELVDCSFYGTPTTEAFTITGTSPCTSSDATIRGCWFDSGAGNIAGTRDFRFTVADTHIAGGFSWETGSTTDYLAKGRFVNLSSDDTNAKRAFKTRTLRTTGIQNANVLDLPMGTALLRYDKYWCELALRSVGSTKARKIEIDLDDDTDTITYALGDFTSAAGEGSQNYRLLVETYITSATQFSVILSWLDDTAGTTTRTFYQGTVANAVTNAFSLRIDSVIGTGPGDEGDSSWIVLNAATGIDSQLYHY